MIGDRAFSIICHVWLTWFATAGLTETTMSLMLSAADHLGVTIPDSLAAFAYIVIGVFSGIAVLWTIRQLTERHRAEVAKMRELHKALITLASKRDAR